MFLDLLHKLVTETYRDARRVHIILDNYGIHDSQQVQLALKLAAASRIKLHFLPPYCPDHNRIERLWKDLHDNVTRNHRCAGMEKSSRRRKLNTASRRSVTGTSLRFPIDLSSSESWVTTARLLRPALFSPEKSSHVTIPKNRELVGPISDPAAISIV